MVLSSGLVVNGAQAQQAAPTKVASSPTALEEIIVTSRKVAEKLQDIPVTVTAFKADDLEKANIIKQTDLNNLTPGLNFQDGTGRGGSGRFFVRGLTGGVQGQARASTFLDGVYVANNVANIMFGEIERVEVMLGPQSAQFGRATFGGGMNFITKEPKGRLSGSVAVNVATLGGKQLDAFVGGPLIQDVLLGSVYVGSMRFEGPSRWRNPPDIRHPDGIQLGAQSSDMGAVKLVFMPNDDLRITGRLSQSRDDDAHAMSYIMSPDQRNGVYMQTRTVCTAPGVCTNGPAQPAYYFAGTLNPPGGFSFGFPNGVVNADTEANPNYRNTTTRATLVTDWQVAKHNLKLTLSSNDEVTPHGSYSDADVTYFPSSRFLAESKVKDKSVELRIDSDQKQKLRYSLGAYYLKLNTETTGTFASEYFCNTICTITNPASMYNTATLVGYSGSIGGSLGRFVSPYIIRGQIEDKSVFGGLFYDLTDKWTVSFEGRQQTETITSWNISNPAAPIGGVVEFKSFLPRFNLQYKINDNAQVYGVYSVGNNPGGLNTATQLGKPGTGTSLSQREIKEEKLKNYELGFKSTMFNNTLKINGSVYRMDWTNLQNTASYFDPASTIFSLTENRGKARIDGFGLEGEWVATKNLSLRGQASYNNGRYLQFCSTQLANLLYGPAPAGANSLLGADPSCLASMNARAVNVSGKKLETSPAKTGSLSFDYHQPVMDGWTWSVRGGVQYADGQWESEMNLAKSPNATVYTLSTELKKGNWSYEIFCANCSDEDAPMRSTRLTDPRASNAPVASGGLGYNQTVGNSPRRPRQVGATVRYKF